MKNIFYKKRQRNSKKQSRRDNPEELAILRTQDEQNQHKHRKLKRWATQTPITLYLQFYYVFMSLQKTGCTTNRVRFTTLQSTSSDLLISNYILFFRDVNLLCYSKWMRGCTFGKQMSLTYIFVFGNGLSNVTGLTIYTYPNAT